MVKCSSVSLIGALLLLNCGYFVAGQYHETICATFSHHRECEDMLRGMSEVRCILVQDPIECAQRIMNGTADLGIFSAESTLQLAVLDWTGLVVTKELRDKDRPLEPVDFESVVIVRVDHKDGLAGLRGKKFCHPGLFFGSDQKWTERFQKHFERTVVSTDCAVDGHESTAEVEASAMTRFFSETCRPGTWSLNDEEDRKLKAQFPSLCSLCGTESCSYVTSDDGSREQHYYALQCLLDRGDVTYVSKQEAMSFFDSIGKERVEEFAYLCENGTLVNILDNNNPCIWLRQPWGVILSKDEKAISHSQTITRWASGGGAAWQDGLYRILTDSGRFVVNSPPGLQSPRNHIRAYRNIPVSFNPCVDELRWCTTSLDERNKCLVMAAAGISTGTLPSIGCNDPRTSVLECMSDIRSSQADVMSIDSNFGYLARNVYNLTAALYAETEEDKFASVAILVHRTAEFSSLGDLRGKRVCMPEFGGIASIAFVNQLKASSLVDRKGCDYGQIIGGFFADSCVPGSRDTLHDPNGTVPENLCNLCRSSVTPAVIENADVLPDDISGRTLDENGEEIQEEPVAESEPLTEEEIARRNLRGSCSATSTNRYYGNQGALRCLDEIGEVAVLEAQFLNDHSKELRLNPNNYRILCRNGSLADRTGFEVEEDCFLTTIVDSEVVVRRHAPNITDTINTLLSLEKYFGTNPHFRVYNIFGGIKNLLFKDSTQGLQSAQSPLITPKVQNYVNLFRDVENCNNSAGSLVVNLAMTICLFLGVFLAVH